MYEYYNVYVYITQIYKYLIFLILHLNELALILLLLIGKQFLYLNMNSY